MIDVDRFFFETLVEDAWNELPDEWRTKLDDANISYQIADFPSSEIITKLKLHSVWGLLGLYTGVPKISRRGFVPLEMPDIIMLFQKPITSRARDIDNLKEIIRHVLYHEIGHYFGLNEEELRQAQGKSNPF